MVIRPLAGVNGYCGLHNFWSGARLKIFFFLVLTSGKKAGVPWGAAHVLLTKP